MPSILDATERSWKSQQKMEFRFEGIYILWLKFKITICWSDSIQLYYVLQKWNHGIRSFKISFELSHSVFLIKIPRFAVHFSSNLLHESTNYVLMNTDIINLLSSCIFKWTILYRFIDVHRSIRSCNTMAPRTEWKLQYALSLI